MAIAAFTSSYLPSLRGTVRPQLSCQASLFTVPRTVTSRSRLFQRTYINNNVIYDRPVTTCAAASGPDNVALIAAPPAAFQAAATLGATKAKNTTIQILVLGFAAGAYLALGGLLALSVGGAVPGIAASNPGLQKLLFGAVGLPIGLTLVVATGAELFLGNCMLLTAAALTGKTSWGRVVQHWALAYTGNLIGALSVAGMVCAAKAVTPAALSAVCGLAAAKTAEGFSVMVWRGVICNWLVCLGVYMANASRDLTGKFVAVLMCVTTFVSLGMDNCVANMFFIPLAMLLGSEGQVVEIKVAKFLLANLIPVTLGNLLGGAVFVGCLYFVGYGTRKKKMLGEIPQQKEMQSPGV